MAEFGREGFDDNTGNYRCARCGEETPGNGGVMTCAVVSFMEADPDNPPGVVVRNLRLCYQNGCAKDLFSTGKLTALDAKPVFPDPIESIPQENPGARPVPIPAANDDPRARQQPPADNGE